MEEMKNTVATAGLPAAAAMTRKAIVEAEENTEMGWEHLRGGPRPRRMRCPCRRGRERLAGGTSMPLGMSSTRPCRPNRLVSSHAMF